MTLLVARLAAAADFLGRGGIINAIIGALYLVVVVVAAERALYFIRTGYSRPAFLSGLERLAEAAAADDGRADAFPWPARYARSQAVRLVSVALRERDRRSFAIEAPSFRTQRSGAPESIAERGALRWIPGRPSAARNDGTVHERTGITARSSCSSGCSIPAAWR